MKKNISINISGIIFHIEEDGYDTLRRYLDSITKYFSSFEDSSEIMADIESRIAEIFLSKLSEGKQVITADDVNALITTMGSVSDFKAAEEQPEAKSYQQNTGGSFYAEGDAGGAQAGAGSATYVPPKVLRRDQKRKILGGVCSGIANYMNVDSLWVRLVFALFFFAWGFALLIYIIMWIVVPGTYDMNEPEVGKKMFRDPDRRILAGVSGGVASYLNIDILAVRILFILLLVAGGFGLFLYIVLWVVLPEARTLTERMQMQGEPVTLSNIESTIKKNQEGDAAAPQESDLSKVLLFPFRVIGAVLQALAKVIGPLAEVLRVVVGIFIIGVGIMFLLSILGLTGVSIGILSNTMVDVPWHNPAHELGVPMDAFLRAIPGWVIFAGFTALIIPALGLLLLGISVIARRIVFSATVGWSLFALFFICIALLSVGIPNIVYSFKETGEFRIENTYTLPGKTAVLKLNEVGIDDYKETSLNLKGHEGKDFRLVQVFRAQGPTRAKGIENAKMVDYHLVQRDSTFIFDSNLTFKEDAVFRGQEVELTLYVPYNYPFTMDHGVLEFITDYISWEDREGENKWQVTENGLECITCPKPSPEELAKMDLRDFDQLDLQGIFDVRVIRGNEYSIELKGPDSEKEKYNVYRSGKTLVIDYQGKESFNWDWNFDKVKDDQVYISITMPEIERLEAAGFGNIQLDDFHVDDMQFELRGPIDVDGQLRANDVMVHLTGKSVLTLNGECNNLTADVEFASKLKAYNFNVKEAIVEVKGASSAKLNVSERLEIHEGLASDIDYRGEPQVIRKER